MPVNLINEKALNEYLTDIVYHGQEMETFTKGEFNSPAYVRQNKDAIVRSMVMQWMKHRLRAYLTEERAETKDFLQAVKQDEENLPGWAKRCLAEGKPVHRFIVDKIPARLSAEIGEIRDYLHSAADSYVNKTLDKAEETEGKPRLRIDYLKSSNEWDSYEKTLYAAKKWHELLAKKAEKKTHDEKMYRESLAGTKSVMKLDNGMEIVQLTTEKALDFESEYMGHCVGQGSYDEGVRDGTIKIYSLRDENGEPHATFEVRVNKETGKEEIYQCKGKGNKAPVARYRPYVQAFVREKKFEIKGDMLNIGLIKQYDENTNKEEYYDLYHLPKGFVVEGDLDFSRQDITELPDLSEIIVKGNFNCSDCKQLMSLKGAPKEVWGNFRCRGCDQLTNLEEAPEKVGGDFDCSGCGQLTSLKWAPEEVGGYFDCNGCEQLMSFEGAPKEVGGSFYCDHCEQLTSLKWAPEKVGGSFNCSNCSQLESLEGAPEKAGRNFYCICCPQLTSLGGAPKEVGGDFYCDFCPQLTSLEGAPEKVGGDFDCSGCGQLMSFEGAPKEVGGYFSCEGCPQLTSLEGAPEVVGGKFDCRQCRQLKNLEGSPKVVGGDFYCEECPQLTSLNGAPKEVGGFFNCDKNIATKYGISEWESDYAIVKEAIEKKHNSEKAMEIRGKLQESKKEPKNVRDDTSKRTSQRKNDYSRE